MGCGKPYTVKLVLSVRHIKGQGIDDEASMLEYAKDGKPNTSPVTQCGASAFAYVTAAQLLAYAFLGNHQRCSAVNQRSYRGNGAAYITESRESQLGRYELIREVL